MENKTVYVTQQELIEFTHFAQEKLADGGADTIEQLAAQWRQSRELAQLVSDIAQSEADIEAGRVHPADEVFAEIRQRLGALDYQSAERQAIQAH